MITLDKFIDTVREMRDNQKQYFKTRNKSALIESKRLEKEVDTQIDHLKR